MIDLVRMPSALLLGALLAALAGGCGSSSNADGSEEDAWLTGGSGGDDGQSSGGGESDGAGGSGADGSGAQGGSGTGGVPQSGGAGGDGTGGADGMAGSASMCEGAPALLVGEEICRGNDDCLGGFCSSTPQSGGCGACHESIQECQGDESCGTGMICENQPNSDPCSCSGWDTHCVADCTSTGCGEDFVCGDAGRCEPLSCEDGFVCHENYKCGPSLASATPNGCAPKSCEAGEVTCDESELCDPGRASASIFGCVRRHCATDGYVCPEGSHCETDALNFGCVPEHCLSDEECPVNSVCDPEAPGKGCVKRSCAADSDCDCGACVFEKCEQQVFYCSWLVP